MTDFDIRAARDGDVLVAVFSGESNARNSREMARRYLELLKASGLKKVLADLSALEGRLSAGETYFLLRDLPLKPVPHDVKTAVLEDERWREYASFFESTSANAGVPLRCFFDRAAALAWLREPGPG